MSSLFLVLGWELILEGYMLGGLWLRMLDRGLILGEVGGLVLEGD